jgi:hypothetical protein
MIDPVKRKLSLTSIHMLVILLIFSHGTTQGADLYHAEINIKAKEGKDLIMALDEVERQVKFSIIRVEYTSGASVPSSMFVVKGCYEIANIRGMKYFINLKEWTDEEGNWLYKIGFSEDNHIDPKVFFGDSIDENRDLEFLSVEDYDVFWRNK